MNPPATLNETLTWVRHEYRNVHSEIMASRPIDLHSTLGRALRNRLSLWVPETPLATHFRDTLNIHHPDDMSHHLLIAYQEKYRETPNPG